MLTAIGVFLLMPLGFSAQQNERVKLIGQVVCSICWFEASDRKKTPYGDAADIQCAIECADEGIPQALAVEEPGGFRLYILERGKFETKGNDFLSHVPAFVEIEGTLRAEKDKQIVRVDSLRGVERPAAPVRSVSDNAVLSLKDLAGTAQDISSFRGRVAVVNFWATWCEPCRSEMPDLASIQNDYAPLGVQVIGASADTAADTAKVLSFVREVGINFPVWLGATTEDTERFGVGSVLPGTVIVDREGKIVWRHIGVIDPKEMRQVLDRLLLPAVEESERNAKLGEQKRPRSSLVPA
ncbi:MAG TPA: TlpA disulfide reductase family protein [Pyrinomonadaceae bacterium]|nr:TlpA disulfide reductase family protein [Pyrinomonadaceae bacterium]